MKRLFLVLSCALLVVSSVLAQEEPKAHLGILGGINMTKEKYSESSVSFTTDNLLGLQLGLVYEYDFNRQMAFSSGIILAQRGGKVDEQGAIGKDLVNFLEVPLNLMLKFDLKGPKLLVLAGPRVSYAVSGTSSYESGGEKESGSITFGNGEDDYKPLGFELDFGGGLEFGRFQVKAIYSLGLSNHLNIEGASMKNNGLGLTLTYFFR